MSIRTLKAAVLGFLSFFALSAARAEISHHVAKQIKFLKQYHYSIYEVCKENENRNEIIIAGDRNPKMNNNFSITVVQGGDASLHGVAWKPNLNLQVRNYKGASTSPVELILNIENGKGTMAKTNGLTFHYTCTKYAE